MTTTTIPPSTMPLISPSTLLQAYLSQTPPTRPSNRPPGQVRQIFLNTSSLTHCNGSSLVKTGESTVVCGVRAELLPVSSIPHYRATHKGSIALNSLLVPNIELSTNSHPSFPANVAPTVIAQSISQRLLSLLLTSELVRIEDLEIRYTSENAALDPDDEAYVEPERDVLKAYWVLYIDCVCLSYGGQGNVFDAAVCAIVAALRDTKLPRARWDEDEEVVKCDAMVENASRLTLNGLPCPLSFGLFVPDERVSVGDGKKRLVLDLDEFEDDVCEEMGNVVVDCSDGECRILKIQKAGGTGGLDVAGLREVVVTAEKRWYEWKKSLDGVNRSAG